MLEVSAAFSLQASVTFLDLFLEQSIVSIHSTEERIKWIQSLVDTEGHLESPVDINLSNAIPFELPILKWHHHELPPKKIKLTNTGHTSKSLTIFKSRLSNYFACSYIKCKMASRAPFPL